MTETQNNTKSRLARALEALFLVLTGLYLIYRAENTTTIHMHWPGMLEPCLEVAMSAVAALRLITVKRPLREKLAAVGLAAIYVVIWCRSAFEFRFMLFLAAMTVGFIGIDYRRILKVYLATVGAVYCVAVGAGMLGVITNYVRIKDGLRSSWGICYPTDFATMGLFLLLMLWVTCRALPDWEMLPLCGGFLLISGLVARSSTSTICGILMICAVLFAMFERRVIERRDRLRWMSRGAEWFSTLAFPVLALCMFALMLLYARETDIGYRLNVLLTDRLKLSVDAWKAYGLKAFGTPYEQHGNGFSVFLAHDYNFVDSSYPLIAIRYGWVLFLAYCVSWGMTVRRAIRCADRRLMLALGIIAVHAFAEHHFTECNYNILVAMPLAAYLPATAAQAAGDERRGAKYAADALTALLVVAAAIAFGPALLARLKTALEYLHLGHGQHCLRLTCVMLGGICGVCALTWALNRVLRGIIGRAPRREYARAALLLAACALIGGAGWLFAGRIVGAAARDSAPAVEADRGALEIAAEAATGRVYSGVLPEVYRRAIPGISYAAFFEDDLARLRGDTVLMPSDDERGAFFDSGCLYIPISDTHALYTGDRAVVEALTNAGYQATGYYSNAWEVDLFEAANINQLAYGETTGLSLYGTQEEMLWDGPYYSLYGGKYNSTWTLYLPRGVRCAGRVCTLRINAYRGEELLLEKEISAEQFDGDGWLSVSIPFSIPDTRNVSFEVQPAPGRRVDLRGVRFVRTPDYDVHTFYDGKLRVVREEYYALDGARTLISGGYFACDTGYDRWSNVDHLCYYGRDDRPTMCTSGYAELRRTFNANRQIVRVAYFDTNGQPVALTSGQAVEEREYDGAGNANVYRYYGVDGRPVIINAGYAELRLAFNDEHQCVREEYYGVDGSPVPLSTGQYATEREYDEAGNVSAQRFYGEDGALKARKEGYAEIRWTYNGQHQIVREAFFDAEGMPVLINTRQAANERELDEAGNAVVFRYYDTQGQPIVTTHGFAELRRAFDGNRRVVREAYFGADGQPIALYDGQYGIENEYDEVGNVSVRRFYGADGQRTLIEGGYAEVHWRHNEMRQVIREEFYGLDGEPIEINNGQAANEREYDGAGNAVVYRYYDAQGRPTVITDGYAEVHRTFNDRREVVREAYFDTKGAPLAQPEGHCAVERDYDEMGNAAVLRYLDAEGEPTAICYGYAEVRRVYNSKRQMIREAYFDVNGAPCVQAAGHCAIEQEFDGDGRRAFRRYLDAAGKPMQRTDGYAQARWAVGEDGVRAVKFYDLNDDPVSMDGLNLAEDVSSGWSKWFTPKQGTNNINFYCSTVNLGEKQAGDTFTCQVEVEFRAVEAAEGKPFAFFTHGPTDGVWNIGNVWNTTLVKCEQAPADGVYTFTSTQAITEANAGIDRFDIYFRCDYWAGGSFRVRGIKVEKGDVASAWTPGI